MHQSICIEKRILQIEDIKLQLLMTDVGSDEWFILWPGMGATAEEFLDILKMGQHHSVNVVSIDPPGHGQSEEWPGVMAKETVEQIWLSLFDQLNIQCAYIGGHSYGAYAAVWGAGKLVGRISGLILLDGGYMEPFTDTNFDQVAEQNKMFLESRVFDSWEDFLQEERESAKSWNQTIETMLKSIMKCENGKIIPRISLNSANQVSKLLSLYRLTDIDQIDVPILLLYATEPEEFNAERLAGIKKLGDLAKQLTTVAVPNSGHDLLVDNPTFVTNEIWAFIKRVRFR